PPTRLPCLVSSRLLCVLCSFSLEYAPTEFSALSLHDALPISGCRALRDRRWLPLLMCARCMRLRSSRGSAASAGAYTGRTKATVDRKSTRLNSSHGSISYAVFCLKKKTKKNDYSHYRTPEANE